MRERPIIFSGPMARAILAGTKTQTRRIAKVNDHDCKPGYITPNSGFVPRRIEDHATYCPYGQPGDRLWVRETFCDARAGAAGAVLYRASGDFACRWTSPIHMPRAASRLTLEITAVRVERLNAISGIDAKREGVSVPAHLPQDGADLDWARREFVALWQSINGPGSWESNPWVWVIEFKPLSTTGATP